MNRRDFLGGAVSGAVVAVGGRVAWDRSRPDPLPPPPPKSALPEHARLSFAQQGEDLVLYHALEFMKITKPTYLDVGAADPVLGSNTYLLYTTGARGVLVEPNPMFVEKIRSMRPLDKVVAAGIGVTDQAAADYYEIKGDPARNTFSADQVKALQAGKSESVVERVVKMPLLNINRVIQEQLGAAPDLLSTDIEGLDYAIIRSLDLSRFRPAVICAETVPMYKPGNASDITKYLVAQGYIPRGGSMYNTIYLDTRRIDA